MSWGNKSTFGGTPSFGATSQPSAFGSSTPSFGQPQQQQQQSSFGGVPGGGSTSAFGVQPQQGTGFGVGMGTPTTNQQSQSSAFGGGIRGPSVGGVGGLSTSFGGGVGQPTNSFGLGQPQQQQQTNAFSSPSGAVSSTFGKSPSLGSSFTSPSSSTFGNPSLGGGLGGLGGTSSSSQFGQPQQNTQSSSFLGQSSTLGGTLGGGGGGMLGGQSGGMLGGGMQNQQQQQNMGPGTGHSPYQQFVIKDQNNKNNYINAISAMAQYKNRSFEELRYEDYKMGNKSFKGPNPAMGGVGGFNTQQPGAVGGFSSLGGTSAFSSTGQQGLGAKPSGFTGGLGGGTTSGFGTNSGSSTSSFSFSSPAQNPQQQQQSNSSFSSFNTTPNTLNTQNAFSSGGNSFNKPPGATQGGGFTLGGTPSTQPQSSFSFSSQPNQNTQQPQQQNTGLGGGGFSFSQPNQQQPSTGFSLSGGLGSNTSNLGTNNSAFSFNSNTNTNTAPSSGIGGTTGNFSFASPSQPQQNSGGLGTTLGGGGQGGFNFSQPNQQNKPPSTGGFSFNSTPSTNTNTGLAGGGGGFNFASPAAPSQPAGGSSFSFNSQPSTNTSTGLGGGGGGFSFASPAAPSQPAGGSGFSFNSTPSTSTNTGLGLSTGSGFNFSQQPQQQQQQQQQMQQPQQMGMGMASPSPFFNQTLGGNSSNNNMSSMFQSPQQQQQQKLAMYNTSNISIPTPSSVSLGQRIDELTKKQGIKIDGLPTGAEILSSSISKPYSSPSVVDLKSYKKTKHSTAKIRPRGYIVLENENKIEEQNQVLSPENIDKRNTKRLSVDVDIHASVQKAQTDKERSRGRYSNGNYNSDGGIMKSPNILLNNNNTMSGRGGTPVSPGQMEEKSTPNSSSRSNNFDKPSPSKYGMPSGGTMFDEDNDDDDDDDDDLPSLSIEGYSMEPSLQEMKNMSSNELASINNFKVYRDGIGSVTWLGMTDVRGLGDLNKIIDIQKEGIGCYENAKEKNIEYPEVGNKLNKKAQVTLEDSYPSSDKPLTEKRLMKWKNVLKAHNEKANCQFNDYHDGKWTFTVPHFSRYGRPEPMDLDSSEDENDDDLNNVKKPKTNFKDLSSIFSAKKVSNENENENENKKFQNQEISLYPSPAKTSRVRFGNTASASTVERYNKVLYNENMTEKVSSSYNFLAETVDTYDLNSTRYTPQDTYVESSRFQNSPSPYKQSYNIVQSPITMNLPLASVGMGVSRTFDTMMENSKCLEMARKKLKTLNRPNDDVSRSRADYSLFLGRSFRVGWRKDGTYIHPNEFMNGIKNTKVEVLKWRDYKKKILLEDQKNQPENYTQMLEIHRESCEVIKEEVNDNGLFAPKLSFAEASKSPNEYIKLVSCIDKYAEHFSRYCAKKEEPDSIVYHTFSLINALWGQEVDNMISTDTNTKKLPSRFLTDTSFNHIDRFRRKEAVSSWLKQWLLSYPEDEISASPYHKIYSFLCKNALDKAAECAINAGCLRLATILASANNNTVRAQLKQQIQNWFDSGANEHMHGLLLRVYLILSGDLSTEDDLTAMAKEGKSQHVMDWRTRLGLHLWYEGTENKITDIADAVKQYDSKWEKDRSGKSCAEYPFPWYFRGEFDPDIHFSGHEIYDEDDEDDPSKPKCLIYHILKLFSEDCMNNGSYKFSHVLNPKGVTLDLLDYRLSWILMKIFQSLGMQNCIDENIEANITSSLVFQLTSCGLWEYAIYVVLHYKNKEKRTKAVKDLIEQHVKDLNDEKRKFLVNSLHIPESWIYDAQALHAKYKFQNYIPFLVQSRPMQVVSELIKGDLDLENLISDQSTIEKLSSIDRTKLTQGVSNWTSLGGGEMFYNYLNCSKMLDDFSLREGNLDEFNELLSTAEDLYKSFLNWKPINLGQQMSQREILQVLMNKIVFGRQMLFAVNEQNMNSTSTEVHFQDVANVLSQPPHAGIEVDRYPHLRRLSSDFIDMINLPVQP